MVPTIGSLRFARTLAGAETIEDLTQCLYRGIGAVFDAVIVGFDLLDPDTNRLLATSGHGVSTFFLAKYDRLARGTDPVLQQAIDTRLPAYNLAMMSEAQWRQLPVYRDVFSLHRMTGLVYAPVVIDDRVVATLNLARVEGAPAFTQDELDAAAELADLLAALLVSLQRREQVEHERALYRDALDLAGEPMVISDVRSASRHANRAARRVLEGQPADAQGFDEALIEVESRARRPDVGGGLIERSVAIDDGALVSFLRAEPRPDSLPEWIRHSVTAREAEVIVLVARGLRDAEIAAQLQLSVHTVKGYLRDIFKKTGVRSRVELARTAVGDGSTRR